MKREALVPVDDEILTLVGEQKQRVLQRLPAGAPLLFPTADGNLNRAPAHRQPSRLPRRHLPLSWKTATSATAGQPVHLTPHQWRHTLGTS